MTKRNNTVKLLIFIDHFYPGIKSGGPMVSILNLLKKMPNNIQSFVATLDRDLGDLKSYKGITSEIWIDNSNYHIKYVRRNWQIIFKLYHVLKQVRPDIIYLNSFFSAVFSVPVYGFKKFGACKNATLIVAPRGELCAGAIKIKKIKKMLFAKLFKLLGIHHKVFWHATSEDELLAIKKIMGTGIKVRKVPNMINIIEKKAHIIKNKKPGEVDLIYLSRITKKKNLTFAFDLLKNIEGKINMAIYGPIEDDKYWKLCRDKIDQLPNNIKVKYKGVVYHDKIAEVFDKSHLFLFPTKSENFGHVIVESFMNNVPVIISDQTPWRDLDVIGVGWDISLSNENEFVKIIQKVTDMNQGEYNKLIANINKFKMSLVSCYGSVDPFCNMLGAALKW